MTPKGRPVNISPLFLRNLVQFLKTLHFFRCFFFTENVNASLFVFTSSICLFRSLLSFILKYTILVLIYMVYWFTCK